MKKVFLFVLFSVTFSPTFSQSQQDIVDYLKSRIELYSDRPSTIEFSSCNLKFYTKMILPGVPMYTSEISCSLKDLLDVMYVNDRQVWVALKFRNKNVSYTTIEQEGSRDLWKYDNEINLFFSKGTIKDDDAKKIVELFKKLGRLCDANLLEF